MKTLFLITILSFAVFSQTQAQQIEYKVVTVVESIVPLGLGRSRIIENKSEVDIADVTTSRVDGKTSAQHDVKRKAAKVNEFEESKLLNFFSGVGINFQNIASNDALVTSKINQLAREGWELVFVTSGVESDAGQKDGQGIYITRLIFKRKV